jgi:hypothetical protein
LECSDFGDFTGGTLVCNSFCQFDTSDCTTDASCYDPDGNDSSVQGTLYYDDSQGNSYDHTDDCATNTLVREWICSNDDPMTTYMDCGPNEVCRDGRCAPPLQPHCYDSDGNNSDTRTTLTYMDQYGNNETLTDSCANTYWLTEWICTPAGTPSQTLMNCAPGECSNGECIQ